MLRANLSQNWPLVLSKICDDYNNTPLKKIGWLKPNDINTVYDSVQVKNARNKHNITSYNEPSYKLQQRSQKDYDNNINNLNINDYVYLDFKEQIFGKSFDVQVYVNSVLFIQNSNLDI